MTVQERAMARLVARERPITNLWLDAFQRLLRNKAAVVGGLIVIALVLMAIFAPYLAPYEYYAQTLEDNNAVPSWMLRVFPDLARYARVSDKYLLGADELGRDLLSRIIWGSKVSLAVGFVGPIIALSIGLTYGAISGYLGGRVDDIMMRFVDLMYAFPTLLLIILIMAFFKSTFASVEPGSIAYYLNRISDLFDRMLGLRTGSDILFIFMGIGMTAWMGMARLTRGQILSIKQKEFIEAARTVGASDMRIIVRHILPNIIGPLVVAETLAIPRYISYEAFLSFIGLGVDPPTPSWGMMIAEGSRAIRSYPHQAIFPALALAITMFAFNFLGDGLRDALDPRMRGTT